MPLSGKKDIRTGIEFLRIFMNEPDPTSEKNPESAAALKRLIDYNHEMIGTPEYGPQRQYWIKEAARGITATGWTRYLGWWTRRKLKQIAELQIKNEREIPEFKPMYGEEIAKLVIQGELEQARQKIKARKLPKYEDLYGKREFSGTIEAVQPRIQLTRSFDESAHRYQGFNITLRGQVGEKNGKFIIAVGKATHAKHGFCRGQIISGTVEPVEEPKKETAGYYKASGIKVTGEPERRTLPPVYDIPPPLETYRERGPRRLDARTYTNKCAGCQWGCRMPTMIIKDHWDSRRYGSNVSHRYETFCYGPKSCPVYSAGKPRSVTGRNGEQWTEPDWVDDNATMHRGPEE